ncbi:helix-turn-helix domain-containing protein [Sphaerisporangium sp. TRM90804]|uniref:GlxA family transcriptional regulator n=1 Tax=Sphaerisporangium sp. TRM90804 TaxID=3031113 RepID=UPI00244861BF|nr:helix-turn-helix domain-containing protein [Sphaerisporangium sp. TRM90804]MDH2425923.1 helix-turn-helix domain-containing protein [Sphaerisporangium sp. TRM90804]
MDERRFAVVGYEGAELLDIACVTTGLVAANHLGADPPYFVRLATPGARTISCGTGLRLEAQECLERLKGPLDTLLVSGGFGHEHAAGDAALVGHVRRLAAVSRRVASVCTGATVLAAAGLLDGRRATTHWGFARRLAERYPKVSVDAGPLFIRDGEVYTGAGVTSALDLTLALIEADHGAELARQVSRSLVTYLQRPGNQAQMSMFVTGPPPEHALVRRLTGYVAAHLDSDLTSAALAASAGVSERHLHRLFLEHLGQSPARFVRKARAEAAAHLLSSTPLPVAAIARRCGFGSAETLRQAFADIYGLPPSRYRAASQRTPA